MESVPYDLLDIEELVYRAAGEGCLAELEDVLDTAENASEMNHSTKH